MSYQHWSHREPFREVPWADIAAFLDHMAYENARFSYLADVAHSVIDSGGATVLAGCTSMHDIVVVPRPVPEPPFEAVLVRAPSSLHPPRDGNVLVEHISSSGRREAIERPPAEAVGLFWRFVAEKFGVLRPDDLQHGPERDH